MMGKEIQRNVCTYIFKYMGVCVCMRKTNLISEKKTRKFIYTMCRNYITRWRNCLSLNLCRGSDVKLIADDCCIYTCIQCFNNTEYQI